MSAEAPAVIRRWSWGVGGYVCTLTVPKPNAGKAACCSIEWSPAVPDQLDAELWAEYRAGRDKAIADWARELGLNVAVVDL